MGMCLASLRQLVLKVRFYNLVSFSVSPGPGGEWMLLLQEPYRYVALNVPMQVNPHGTVRIGDAEEARFPGNSHMNCADCFSTRCEILHVWRHQES